MAEPASGFQPIRRSRAFEQVIAQVRAAMQAGRLKPGDQLPAERELCELLKVSRTSVREAMRSLEALGIIESRPGQGTYLRAAELPGALVADAAISWESHHLILEARIVLEPQLAALAAERATPENLARLREIVTAQAAEVAAGRSGTEEDLEFHAAVSRAAGNGVLRRILDDLGAALREQREKSRRAPARWVTSVEEHRAILAAIEAHDAEAAEQRMRDHLEEMRRQLIAAQAWSQPSA
jgi:GntR family transcriptional repressor for pyruvate dehydrogenase complex